MKRRPIIVALLSLLANGCGSSGLLVVDQLDPVTGVTTSHAVEPLVLYRDSSGVAAHARDFVYVGPLQVNRMGEYRYYLWLGIWGTIQDRDTSAQRDGFESITIFVDGEPLRLDLKGWAPGAIGISEHVYPSPTATAANAYYPVTLDQVRLIAEAADLRLRTSGAGTDAYEPWDDPRKALSGFRDFLDH